MRCSKRRKLKEPEQTQTEAINNILAIEHQALNILAIKYFPEPKTMTEATTQSSEQVPPSTPAETRIRSVKQKTKNNYITKLYGWSAWWSMVERQNRPDKSQVPVYQKLSSLEKSKFRFRKSEAEKIRFIEKYHPCEDSNRLIRPEKSVLVKKPEENVHTEGGVHPKKKQKFWDFRHGGNRKSTKKKI